MPATFTSLLVFVVLAAPGFAYAAVRERRYPERTSSAFRETCRVTLASVVFDSCALLLTAVLRAAAPGATPDVGRLVRNPGPYWHTHYASAFAYALVLLGLAVFLSALAAWWLPRPSARMTIDSSWWLLFSIYPQLNKATWIRVSCELTDGTWLEGRLQSFSYQQEETGDRELTLGPPLVYKRVDGTAGHDLSGLHRVSISARQIKFLGVTYVKEATGEGSGSAAERGAAPVRESGNGSSAPH